MVAAPAAAAAIAARTATVAMSPTQPTTTTDAPPTTPSLSVPARTASSRSAAHPKPAAATVAVAAHVDN